MELPRLGTDRLRLDALGREDAERVARLAGDRAVARQTESIPHPYSVEEAETFLSGLEGRIEAGEEAVFAIRLAADDGLVGAVGVHPEPEHGRARLGYWVGRPYWGRGYATEAGREAVDWAFEALELRRIYAEVFARNGASRRVLEKLGLQWEGRLRRHFRKWDQFVDVEVFGLLRQEWRTASGARPRVGRPWSGSGR